ncbi:thiamine transport system permease protein [Treponema rectale]|uniref:Thiamine transport system permease protein n=1 Tax=Treponema rectale TaxID=744512 RepID=A0A840SJ58_9SPIR|nr:iron ABC transporter permease [Treponema rectale]MBB5219421.1 thiamine transport system permease protein [Treponema rectale]
MFKIIIFTFEQALASVGIALLAGIPGAYFIARKTFPAKKILKSLSVIPLCVPALMAALGYISALGLAGWYNRILISLFSLKEPPLRFLYSFSGIAITQGFYNFPLIMKSTADVLSQLDHSPEESAELLGAGQIKIFFTITLPRIIPAIIAGAVPVFIFCYFSFMIILMFGIPGSSTIETEIYFAARMHKPFSKILLLCTTETILAIIVIFTGTLYEKKSEQITENSFSIKKQTPVSFSKKEFPFAALYFIIIFIFFVIPFFSIPLNSFFGTNDTYPTLKYWKFILSSKSFIPSVTTSIIQASITGLLCTATAIIFSTATRLCPHSGIKQIIKTIPLLPMAISSVAASVIILKITALSEYNTNLITLCAVQTFLYWPFAFRQIYASASRISDEVIFSAKLLSNSKTQFLTEVFFPATKRSCISAFLFSFAISIGDASLPVVLAIPEYTSLALFTYRLFGYRFPAACCTSMILGIVCITLCILAEKIGDQK